MVGLPPGTILQLMYLRARLERLSTGHFIEIGPGSGEITGLLLERGWSGVVCDLDATTIDALKVRFRASIVDGRLVTLNGSFLKATPGAADLVISCMVMEHLDDSEQAAFLAKAAQCLRPGGLMIGLVPASPAHWGIEDDIAGHCRRYTREALAKLAPENGWKLSHVAGLTYPISNLLLPLSNFLVNRAERAKLAMPVIERTRLSGRRDVSFKTRFPAVFGVLINVYTMFPLYLLQRMCAGSKNALTLYFEMQPG